MKGTFDTAKMRRKLADTLIEAGQAVQDERWPRLQGLLTLAASQVYVIGMIEGGECEEAP